MQTVLNGVIAIIHSIQMRWLISGIVIFTALGCYAKSGNEHLRDMQEIFPFDVSRKVENKKIFEIFAHVNAYLDYTDFPTGKSVGKPKFIKESATLKDMTFANHRIWYHWGFNGDPKKFVPLVDMVKQNIDRGTLKPEYEYIFWDKLKANIGERNNILTKEWGKVFGYQGNLSKLLRDQSNGFITLLVAIHLLGDHTTTETAIILDKNTLYAEIITAIYKIAGNRQANRACAKSLEKKLRTVKDNPKKFINVLKQDFTPFLYDLEGAEYNYKKKFQKLGYCLKD